ncbi:porin family protein [Chitinophagaceae bacterium MMS25-I14]
MKKIIALMLAIVALSQSSFAQDHSDMQRKVTDYNNRLEFGIKAGGNYATVYDKHGDAFNVSGRVGFATGLFARLPVSRYFGIQPEILFSQRNFQATGVLFDNTYNFTRTSSYLDVPVLVAFKPCRLLTLLAGPQYSYLLQQRDDFKNASTSIEQEKQFEDDHVRRNTISVVSGFDVNLMHFVVSGRMGWDMLNNNGDGSSATPRYKSVWLQATLGYRFYH